MPLPIMGMRELLVACLSHFMGKMRFNGQDQRYTNSFIYHDEVKAGYSEAEHAPSN